MGRVWLEYARYLEERGKLRTAQQVYLRALMDKNNKESTSDHVQQHVQQEQSPKPNKRWVSLADRLNPNRAGLFDPKFHMI